MTNPLKKFLSMMVLVPMLMVTTSCAWWAENKGDVKSVVKTVDEVAQALCGVFYGDKMNISVQDAVRTFCDTRDKYEPWIDQVLAGAKAGGDAKLAPKSSAAPPALLPLGDPWAKPAVAPAPIPTVETTATPAPAPAVAPATPAPTPSPVAEPPAKGKAGGKGVAK
ncbi:MAG: hypothetical protein WC565_01870 [Parcubacteria group bacterium]